jgi:hypothetical protein
MKTTLLKTTLLKSALLIAATFGIAAVPADAQGLKGLMKKTNKVLGTVSGAINDVKEPGNTVKLDNGGTLQNALAGKVDIELVGVYGRSTSNNYGEVYMVLKMRMNENKTSISIGSNSSWPATLVDQDGNAYNLQVGWYDQTVTEGIFQKVSLSKNWAYKDVKKTATTVQLARIGLSLDYNTKGYLTIKNVPILWDVNPETNE